MIAPHPNRPKESTFAELIAGREAKYPTLARAQANSRPANRERIEWTVDVNSTLRSDVWHNYTQIIRWAYSADEDKERATDEFLTAVEKVLVHGVPSSIVNPHPFTTCGGYRHYLGRELNDNDVITLRPLREPRFMRLDRYGVPLDTPVYEWLAEFSLQVVPQHP